jgi:hypothetical protein
MDQHNADFPALDFLPRLGDIGQSFAAESTPGVPQKYQQSRGSRGNFRQALAVLRARALQKLGHGQDIPDGFFHAARLFSRQSTPSSGRSRNNSIKTYADIAMFPRAMINTNHAALGSHFLSL